MKRLSGFLNELEQLDVMIPDEDIEKWHQKFNSHLGLGGYQPASKCIVGRVSQEHVVLGKIMQYGKLLAFRAAILNNWKWMPLDPPQPILNEHNYWEICYQMGFASRKLYCSFVGKRFRARMYTPHFLINIYEKLVFGQKASVETRISERTIEEKNMDICTVLYRFYTGNRILVAEAGLKIVCFLRDFEILIQQAKDGSEEARKQLINLIKRRARQRDFRSMIDPQNLITEINIGKIIEQDIAQIFAQW